MSVHGFRRTATGRVILRVDVVEKGLLLSLLEQLVEFVTPEGAEDEDPLVSLVGLNPDAARPEDPALARLFPDAYLDDVESSAQFRRFTERSLRETKLAHAATAIETLRRSGEKVTLSADEASAWLGALNDVRLALGTRLGITEDGMAELADLPDEDPRAATFHVYDWLTYLQESLVQSVMP
ncbi:MAG: hypothetical protein RL134_2033 [Actinomycetota bacterium]